MDVCAFGSRMSLPKSLSFNDFEGLTESWTPGVRLKFNGPGMFTEYLSRKLPLWADFRVLIATWGSRKALVVEITRVLVAAPRSTSPWWALRRIC